MQKQPIVVFFLSLAVVSLACFTTTEPFEPYPAETPTLIKPTVTPVATSVRSTQAPLANAKPSCAVISADEALHLRVGPDEHSRSLAFMLSGEVVTLISAANVDWWRIKIGDQVGYARSKYLEKSECIEAP